MSKRLLLEGLRRKLGHDVHALAYDTGKTTALGEERKAELVLTDTHLLIASKLRLKTVLTTVPRADIRTIEPVEPGVTDVVYDDFERAIRRLIRIDLRKHADRERIIQQLETSLGR